MHAKLVLLDETTIALHLRLVRARALLGLGIPTLILPYHRLKTSSPNPIQVASILS
jgi:hypothetical protein